MAMGLARWYKRKWRVRSEFNPSHKDNDRMSPLGMLPPGPFRTNRYRLAAGLLLGLLFLAWALGSGPTSAGLPSSGTVSAVFDGDTVLLQSGEKVRYLGMDAPEVEHNGNAGDCFGPEAKKANQELVLHKQVSLHYDRETMDHHGRLLAYITLSDGRCVNGELIRGGFAHVFRSAEGFSRFGEFVALQREALANRRGMWSACPFRPARNYVANRTSGVFHRAGCRFGKMTNVRNALHFETRWAALEQGCSPCRRCKP
jgi:micrococcal nuclease